jgi:hypothetical protein
MLATGATMHRRYCWRPRPGRRRAVSRSWAELFAPDEVAAMVAAILMRRASAPVRDPASAARAPFVLEELPGTALSPCPHGERLSAAPSATSACRRPCGRRSSTRRATPAVAIPARGGAGPSFAPTWRRSPTRQGRVARGFVNEQLVEEEPTRGATASAGVDARSGPTTSWCRAERPARPCWDALAGRPARRPWRASPAPGGSLRRCLADAARRQRLLR